MTGRRAANVEAVAAEIESRGRRTLRVPADVAEISELERVRDACVQDFGRLDIMVYAAGTTKRVPTLEMSEADWQQVMDTNITGMFRSCQVFGGEMVRRGSGRIIAIGSLSSFVGLYEVAAYVASKSAVAGLTRALAVEWAPHGVNVNAIAPGVFRTDLNTALLDAPRGQEFKHAHADETLRADRGARRRRDFPCGRCVGVRHRTRPRGGRRVPRQRSQPVKAALVISERDNVATALHALEPGGPLEIAGDVVDRS